MRNISESLKIESHGLNSRKTTEKKKLIQFVNKINEKTERLPNFNLIICENCMYRCITTQILFLYLWLKLTSTFLIFGWTIFIHIIRILLLLVLTKHQYMWSIMPIVVFRLTSNINVSTIFRYILDVLSLCKIGIKLIGLQLFFNDTCVWIS